MIAQLRPALMMMVLCTIFFGLAYPFAMTCIARFAFPDQAGGSLIDRNGQIIGSALVGQSFAGDEYFHSRPSAAGYDAANSSGSNLANTSAALVERVEADVERLGASARNRVPVDLVTASGSGLDPHLSPAAAYFQAARVAEARGIELDAVRALIQRMTEGRTLGLFGEPRVNILLLNVALDELSAAPESADTRGAGG